MNIKKLRRKSKDLILDDEKSKLIYSYPLSTNKEITSNGTILAKGIPSNELYYVGPFLAAKSPQSHIGPFLWATDFLVSDGTIVLAAQGGKIIEVEEDFDTWGDDPKFRKYLNYLTLQHKSGEYSQYCHLAHSSIRNHKLVKGDKVKRGQSIAIVGKTGWTDRDHLHFVVFRKDRNSRNPYRFKSIQIRFEQS